MATTGSQVFEYAMSLIDERLDSGVVDPTSTAIFSKNAPYILTMLQDEVIRDSDYYKTYTITKIETETDGNYAKYTMPTDFYNAFQIIEIETDGNYELGNDYKWEGSKDLYLPDTFKGTVKVVYYPIPSPITALTDTLVLDDITCRTVLSNGLASRLLTNENRVLANYFGDIYNEMKYKVKRQSPSGSIDILDSYDSTLSY